MMKIMKCGLMGGGKCHIHVSVKLEGGIWVKLEGEVMWEKCENKKRKRLLMRNDGESEVNGVWVCER